MTITQQEIIALAAVAEKNISSDPKANYVTFLQEFTKLVTDKETEARIKLQKEFMEYQNDMQARGTRLIKEAYQRGVRDEREACAKVCEQSASKVTMAQDESTELVTLFLGQRISALEIAAERIRARSAE